MADKPVTHGPDHRPGGFDPTPPGPWHDVVAPGTYPAWSSGTAYSPGDIVTVGVFAYVCLVAQPAGGVQPGVTSRWPDSWNIQAPIFQNSWANVGGSDVPMRYRLSIGAPHILTTAGAVDTYLDHQLEIQGVVTGGSYSTVAFTLPAAYSPQDTLFLVGTDSANNVIVFQIDPNGNVTILGPGTATVGDGTVTTVKLADGSVTTAKLADLSVTSAKIAAGAVGTTQLADGSVTSAKILDGTIAAADIAATGVTAGVYGDASHAAELTVNAEGQVTAASVTLISVDGGSA